MNTIKPATSPRINAYTCNNLHQTITIDRDEGVTPMFISCPVCGQQASSRMYDVASTLEPTHEWYLADEDDIKKQAEEFVKQNKDCPYKNIYNAIKDHTEKGGLSLRKIEAIS